MDDLTFIRSVHNKLNQVERVVPNTLAEYNLSINADKTEKYSITSEENEKWRHCKLLGSKLDTEADISRRKGLAIDAYKTLEKIFENKKIGVVLRIRVFNTYISSVFLYNSELWTLTKSLEESIDAFHRKQLRKVLNIYWPDKISNEELYRRTEVKRWSWVVKKKRLMWLGHLL